MEISIRTDRIAKMKIYLKDDEIYDNSFLQYPNLMKSKYVIKLIRLERKIRRIVDNIFMVIFVTVKSYTYLSALPFLFQISNISYLFYHI